MATVNGLLSILDFPAADSAELLNRDGPKSFQLYVLPENFATKLAAYGDDHLESVSASWSKEEYWELVEVNPFDLFGFLVELKSLCKRAHSDSDRVICAIVSD